MFNIGRNVRTDIYFWPENHQHVFMDYRIFTKAQTTPQLVLEGIRNFVAWTVFCNYPTAYRLIIPN